VPRGGDVEEREAIERHYRAVWPDRVVTSTHWAPGPIAERLPDLHVVTIAPPTEGDPWIYATAGAWRVNEDGAHGIEFVAMHEGESLEVVEQLGVLAFYHAGPPENRLDVGHTLSIGKPWVQGSTLDALLISLPYPWGPTLEHCHVGKRHVRILWVVPIYEIEREFAQTNGVEALERRFDAAGLNVLNRRRASVVDSHDVRAP